jgi:hypothetical protein
MCLPTRPSCAVRQLPRGQKPEPRKTSAHPREASGEVVPEEDVTVSDIAHFTPAAGSIEMQPRGWALVDVPANFIAHAGVVTTTGTLLGQTAQVRFTPVAYQWDYGDGGSATLSSPGATWQQRGQAELTSTPTSHVYRTRGSRSGSLRVHYSAQYRYLDEEWQSVEGTVTGPPSGFTVVVVVERTSLVAA